MNPKNLSIGFILSMATVASFATPVQLPSAELLRQRFAEIGLDHFVEKTTIVKDLAGQSKEPLGVAMSIELAMSDYAECLKNPIVAMTTNMLKPAMFEAILKDHPAALNELAGYGLYKSAKQ